MAWHWAAWHGTGPHGMALGFRYASQTTKEWAEIVKAYEKDGVHIAETAQTLVQHVNYEM
jgi:hypothetical protein